MKIELHYLHIINDYDFIGGHYVAAEFIHMKRLHFLEHIYAASQI